MANTRSTKKSIRSALKKRAHNLVWQKAVKSKVKTMKALIEEKADPKDMIANLVALQKATDKAAKEKVIHKNKANRIKSRYAKRITALQKTSARKSGKSSK